MDDDGRELVVPDRLVSVVRWLVTEAGRTFEDTNQTGKVIIHLGLGIAPPRIVTELHHTLS